MAFRRVEGAISTSVKTDKSPPVLFSFSYQVVNDFGLLDAVMVLTLATAHGDVLHPRIIFIRIKLCILVKEIVLIWIFELSQNVIWG